MPTITEPNRAQRIAGHLARHAHGEVTAAMKTKKASPSTATGKMPNTIDSGLVVTAAQLTNPFSEQTRILGEVKWAMVRYTETPRPPSASTHVVSWNQSGTALTCGAAGAAGSRPAGGRSAA